MNFYSAAVNLTAGNTFEGTVGGMVGYLYGTFYQMSQADRKLTILAFAICMIAKNTFYILNMWIKSTEGEETRPFKSRQFVSTVLLGAIQIIALRELKIIANPGSIALGIITTVQTLENISEFDFNVDLK